MPKKSKLSDVEPDVDDDPSKPSGSKDSGKDDETPMDESGSMG